MYDMSKLSEYEKQIISSYQNYSIVPYACKAVKVSTGSDLGKFFRLGNRLKIERDILLNESHSVFLGNLGISVAHEETKTIVKDIAKSAAVEKLDVPASEYYLTAAIMSQIERGFNPRFIFVPIDYFLDVWKWSSERFRRVNFDGQGGYEWVIDNNIKLRIKYSNKYTPFDNFIIVDPVYNEWRYRPDSKTGGRLTASFEDKLDPDNLFLNVHTLFKFDVTESDANLVLKFKPKKS